VPLVGSYPTVERVDVRARDRLRAAGFDDAKPAPLGVTRVGSISTWEDIG